MQYLNKIFLLLESIWEWMTHDAITVYTLLLVLFTAILALATNKLWRSTERLVQGAEDTAERQLRAYVLIEKAEIFNVEVGKIPYARITLRNSGQTPAKNLQQWSNMGGDTLPASLPVPSEWKDNGSKQPLAPNGEFYSIPRLGRAISPLAYEQLRKGTHAIYVAGEIRYEDAFGKKRYTKYLLFSSSEIDVSTGSLSSCPQGNEYS